MYLVFWGESLDSKCTMDVEQTPNTLPGKRYLNKWLMAETHMPLQIYRIT